ncbi:MAG: UDP-N-acetylmuramoyl-L-alanyl-D-glutamate--2,6-diaminopimelate ligase [Candidatus Competibacteraceae bacterium]
MKKLSEFIQLLAPVQVLNGAECDIAGIACQPEAICPGCLYGVIDEFLEYGHWIEGARLLDATLLNKVNALVTEQPLPCPLPQLVVTDARKSLARAARFFYDRPDLDLAIVGVTGTNGKTTVTHLIEQWLSACGKRTASLGTLGLYQGGRCRQDTVYTTPLAPTVFALLRQLRETGVQVLAMEVSSHALKLDRVFGLDVDVAVFTNLSRDHLDFHGTMEDYQASKLSLFTGLKATATAVVNSDDAFGREIIRQTTAPVLSYGFSESASVQAVAVDDSLQGTRLEIRYGSRTIPFESALVGRFNVYNLLAALGACLALEVPLDVLAANGAALHGVPGRLERVALPGDRVGIVDYSHTPDALEKVLQTLRALKPGRIITVFGCGGNRDKGKRPLMGAVAARASELCVVTSDNPRREDPLAIIDDILAGMPAQRVLVESDRRAAIHRAFALSQPGDVILLAGKGHEPYQIVGDRKLPFSDLEELKCLS